MDLLILDDNFEPIDIIDTYESVIWKEKYLGYSDFEYYGFVNDDVLQSMQKNYYIETENSDKCMVIEVIEITTDVEHGNHLTVSGRSLESILERRIVWNQTILHGSLQSGIQRLLNENIISPTIIDRRITNFIFETSTDPAITSLTVDAQFTGDNLYDAIVSLCESNNIGFKITLTDDKKFKFKLYSGADRSYDQVNNPYVIFSPKFENIMNSNYISSNKTLKTVSLVAGEGEGSDRKTTIVNSKYGAGSGLYRRELYTDARDISSTTSSEPVSETEYLLLLAQRGSEKLAENDSFDLFEGEVETTQLFKYGEDFFMGDIIQISNEYGMETKSRVTEIVTSIDATGISVLPTFSSVE